MTEATDPRLIDENKLVSLCKLKRGAETCSFLLLGGNGFTCAKGTPFEGEINRRRKAKSMGAMGNYCRGAPSYAPLPNLPFTAVKCEVVVKETATSLIVKTTEGKVVNIESTLPDVSVGNKGILLSMEGKTIFVREPYSGD